MYHSSISKKKEKVMRKKLLFSALFLIALTTCAFGLPPAILAAIITATRRQNTGLVRQVLFYLSELIL